MSAFPSVPIFFSRGASCMLPVIDGCSVEPKLRTIEMPSDSPRSHTARGTGEPPRPTRVISAACSPVKSGWSSRLVKKYVEPAPLEISSSSIAASTFFGSHTSMR